MKNLILPLLFLYTLSISASNIIIRINQCGYYPKASKIAIIVNAQDVSDFELIDISGKTVFTGKLQENNYWEASGETAKKADFSNFTQEGTYQLKAGDQLSYKFEIKKDAWRDVAVGILKSYYLQRCNFELEEKYAGIYKRPACHADTDCVFHASSSNSGTLNAPGGWHDAGDFGKYIVSAGVTLGNMLSLYEIYPEVFPDNSTNIPESGNGLSDLLDEAKYELDWFKYMQDEDGGVFVKITTEKYPPMMYPHNDTFQRNVYGKSTASTLHFAACMAMAGRIYKEKYPEYAIDCIKRAEKAWLWALENDNEIFKNPEGVLSGAYSNSHLNDEFLWAAVELFISTEQKQYKEYLLKNSNEFKNMSPSGWADVNGLAITSMAVHSNNLPINLTTTIKTSLLQWSDEKIAEMETSAYQLPSFRMVWGSNGFIGSTGLCFVYAYKVSNDKKYLDAASEVADYILGKNATGYSFVTGYGSKKVVNLHHSISIADGIDGSLPGFVPGGPNPSFQDAHGDAQLKAEMYESFLPAKAYTDDWRSYSSNENDICYSSPVLALITALDYLLGETYPNDWEKYYAFPD